MKFVTKQDPAGEKLRQALIAVQIKAIQRAAEPITLEYNIEDVAGVKKLHHDLIQLNLERKLDARSLGAINGTLTNQLKILIPQPGINVAVCQHVTQELDEKTLRRIVEKLKNYPEPNREAIVNAIADLAKSEISSSSS